MEYNNAGNRGCRIGNWVEEEKLKQLGLQGKSKYETSFARAIEHSLKEHPREYRSTTDSTLYNPRRQRAPGLGLGPRDELLRRKFQREAEAEEADRVEAKHADAEEAEAARRESATKAAFKAPSEEFRRENAAVRIPRGGRREPRPHVPDDIFVDDNVPISMYTQRIVEGAFPLSPTAGANPFARNTGFTNAVGDATRLHIDAEDGTAVDAGNRPRAYAGASHVQRSLLAEVQSYLRPRHPTHVLEALSAHVPDGPCTIDHVVRVLRELNVPLHHRRIAALAEFLSGRTREELVRALMLTPEPLSPGGAAQRATGQGDGMPARFYRASVVSDQSHSPEMVTFSVPLATCKQYLELPQDAPVVKAVLRKQGLRTHQVLSLECL